MNLSNFFGLILIVDAILSLYLPQDKQFMWQVGRFIRFLIGVYFISIK